MNNEALALKYDKKREIERLLIVVDMVNGFVKEGALASPSIQRIIPNIKKLCEDYTKDEAGEVAFIRDSHDKDAEEFKVFGSHCVEGTKETEVVSELREFENGMFTYFKNSTNFVFAPGFQKDICEMLNLKEIVLCGCLTDFCVKNGGITLRNLFDQQNRNIVIIVDAASTDTFDGPNHDRDVVNEASLSDMEANGIKIRRRGELK